MKKLLYFTIFLILASSIFAVNLEIKENNEIYTTFEIQNCSGSSLLRITNYFGVLSSLQQGFSTWDMMFYHYYGDGIKLTASVNCVDGSFQELEFCTNSSSCTNITSTTSSPDTSTSLGTSDVPINLTYPNLKLLFDDYNESFWELNESYPKAVNDSDEDDIEDLKDDLDELKDDLKDLKSNLKSLISSLKLEVPKNETLINISDVLRDQTIILIDNTTTLMKFGECNSYLVCSEWSECDSNLTKTMSCVDKNGCVKPYNETAKCYACLESWTCGAWSTCSSGTQTRACTDEFVCGTTYLKPEEQRSCSSGGSSSSGSSGGFGTVSTSQTQEESVQESTASEDSDYLATTELDLEPEKTETTSQESSVSKLSWAKIGTYVIAGVILVILLVVGIVGYFMFYRKKSTLTEREMELFEYVQKERNKGINDQKMQGALLKSGWSQEEIDKVLKQ